MNCLYFYNCFCFCNSIIFLDFSRSHFLSEIICSAKKSSVTDSAHNALWHEAIRVTLHNWALSRRHRAEGYDNFWETNKLEQITQLSRDPVWLLYKPDSRRRSWHRQIVDLCMHLYECHISACQVVLGNSGSFAACRRRQINYHVAHIVSSSINRSSSHIRSLYKLVRFGNFI